MLPFGGGCSGVQSWVQSGCSKGAVKFTRDHKRGGNFYLVLALQKIPLEWGAVGAARMPRFDENSNSTAVKISKC